MGVSRGWEKVTLFCTHFVEVHHHLGGQPQHAGHPPLGFRVGESKPIAVQIEEVMGKAPPGPGLHVLGGGGVFVGYQPAGLAGGGNKARPAVGVLHGIQDHQDFIQKPLDLRRANGGQVVGQSQRCFPARSFVAVHRAHQPNHQRQISRQGLVPRGLKPRIGKAPELGSDLLHARYVFRLTHHQEQKLAPLERGGVGDELHPIGSGLGQSFSVPLNLQWIADLLTPVVAQHLLDRGDGGIQTSRWQNLQAAGHSHRCP
ncbi:hypothetical protein HRbin09_01831 [bacterium HR09]|nr:hypothetical protein HRbin09_01831 [bacterium HR09]